jgi:hypothetical protein
MDASVRSNPGSLPRTGPMSWTPGDLGTHTEGHDAASQCYPGSEPLWIFDILFETADGLQTEISSQGPVPFPAGHECAATAYQSAAFELAPGSILTRERVC